MNKKQLAENIRLKKSFLCVGLDPDPAKMPASVLNGAENIGDAIFNFNRAIIDATAAYCVAYKPNLAFYECHGADGFKAFARTVEYIRANYPDQFVIADAKRGDIGNTSAMYARAYFETVPCDAITVAPYMGEDSVKPFLGAEGRWVVLLALTSNKGSQDFQMLPVEDEPLFEQVVSKALDWGTPDNMMFVVGATRGQYIADVRSVAPNSFFLVPGVGAQGGSLEEVVRYGMTADCGLIVNSSRGIIHASNADDFAQKAAAEARKLAQQMSQLLAQNGIID